MENNNLSSNDRITLSEAKRRLGGSDEQKNRGGLTKSRFRRMKRRGHNLRPEFHRDPEAEKKRLEQSKRDLEPRYE